MSKNLVMKILKCGFLELIYALGVVIFLAAPAAAYDIEVPTVSAPSVSMPQMPQIPQPKAPQVPQVKEVRQAVSDISQDIENHARGNMKVEYKEDPAYKKPDAKINTNNVPPAGLNDKPVNSPKNSSDEGENSQGASNGIKVHNTVKVEKNNLPLKKDAKEEQGTYLKTHFFSLLAQLFGKTAFIALVLWLMQVFLLRDWPAWADCLSFAFIDSLTAALYLSFLHEEEAGFVFAGRNFSSDELLALGSGFAFLCILICSLLSVFFYLRAKKKRTICDEYRNIGRFK